MIPQPSGERTQIVRLGLHLNHAHQSRDVTALRARLCDLDLHPTELPPSAILLVRRVSAPALSNGIGADSLQGWERAARERIAEQLHRAERPANGLIRGDANAVRFDDQAQMLACFALDWARGQVSLRWWWHILLRDLRGTVDTRVIEILIEKPRYLPAVIGHLVAWQGIAPVLNRVPEVRIRELSRAMTLTSVDRGASVEVELTEAGTPGELPGGPRRVPTLETAKSEFVARALAMLRTPEVTRLRRSAEAQLAGFERAATVPRPAGDDGDFSGGFRTGASVEHLNHGLMQSPGGPIQRGFEASPVRPDVPTSSAPTVSAERGTSERAYDEIRRVVDAASDASKPLAEVRRRRSAPGLFDTASGSGTDTRVPELTVDRDVPKEHRIAGIADVPARAFSDSVDSRGPIAANESVAPVPAKQGHRRTCSPAETWSPADEGTATELGGVLFLVNLMRRLDLPGCFEREIALMSRTGPWGTLEALCRAFLDQVEFDLAADLIWRVLAVLDGREPDRKPTDVVMPTDFSGGVAASVDPIRFPDDGLIAGLGPGLRTWLRWSTPWALRELRRLMRIPESSAAVEHLLKHTGRLHVTSTHVDLVLSLDRVDLAVRASGLDQDPGWRPEFRRVIQFYYR